MPVTPEAQARKAVILLAVLVEGGMVLVSWAVGWFMEHPPFAQIHWSALDALKAVGLTVPLVALALVLMHWPIGPFARIQQFTRQVLIPLLAPCTLIDLVGIAALAGLGEELLFRGVLQWTLCLWMGRVLGIITASLLFGVLHAVTFTYFVLASVMGCYLGWLWDVTGNLLVPIIVHGLYDFALLWYLLYGPGTPPELLQQPDEQPEPPGDNSPEE